MEVYPIVSALGCCARVVVCDFLGEDGFRVEVLRGVATPVVDDLSWMVVGGSVPLGLLPVIVRVDVVTEGILVALFFSLVQLLAFPAALTCISPIPELAPPMKPRGK